MSARFTTVLTCIGSHFPSFTMPPCKRSTVPRSLRSESVTPVVLRSLLATHGWKLCFWSFVRAAAVEAPREQLCASGRLPIGSSQDPICNRWLADEHTVCPRQHAIDDPRNTPQDPIDNKRFTIKKPVHSVQHPSDDDCLENRQRVHPAPLQV